MVSNSVLTDCTVKCGFGKPLSEALACFCYQAVLWN